jgi:HD superfamily phosphohydrolase
MANLVYPGAVHTRFDHTLGVMHVAGLMARQLKIEESKVRLLRLAALLHDVGHGPFSHVSEAALSRHAAENAIPQGCRRDKIHELVTARIIQGDPTITRLIGEDICDQIVKLLSGGYSEPVLKSIVSGPLDADKQDYLLRDSRFCGVQYGVFDIHQLHRSLILNGPMHERQLMVTDEGVHAVEQYVMAKYYMTTNVYRHRVRLITDQMIVRAIKLGVEKDEISDLQKLFRFNDNEDFVANYLLWDDARFMVEFCLDAPKKACGKMLESLRTRRLHKRVFSAKVRDFAEDARDRVAKLSTPEFDELRGSVERDVAKILKKNKKAIGASSDTLIVHCFTIKSVRETSRNDEAGIMVAKSPAPIPFDQESMLFSSIDEKMDEAYCEVYAPVEWESPTERKKVVEAVRQDVFDCINAIAKADRRNQE